MERGRGQQPIAPAYLATISERLVSELGRRTMTSSNNKLVRGLVLWFGLYQFIHIFVNMRGLFLLSQGGIDFPAPPPPGGWTQQVLHFFTGMASLDLLNALLSIVFVIGFFRRARWRWWLGTLALTVSIYAALVFDYATFASGAWTPGNLPAYLFINIAYLPVVWLFGWVCVHGARGELA